MSKMADGSGSTRPNEKGPSMEVPAKAKRRSFTAEYKQRILREADELAKTGGIGAMLRREGLYSSHLTKWRQDRDCGEVAGLSQKKRGRRPSADKKIREQLERSERENARLKKQLAQAEAIIEVQKKVAALLEEMESSRDNDESGS